MHLGHWGLWALQVRGGLGGASALREAEPEYSPLMGRRGPRVTLQLSYSYIIVHARP